MSTATAPSQSALVKEQPNNNGLALTDNPPVGGKNYPVKSEDTSQNALLFDRSKFEQAWSVATMFASSDLIPAHFRNKAANCFIACQLAYRFDMDPFMVMQNTYVVHGKPGFEGKFVIALVNSSGLFKDPLDFVFSGTSEKDDWAVTVTGIRTTTGKKCEMVFRYRTAVMEEWTKNPKWRSMPEQMMMYRGATFFARVFCPEALMGMRTTDELEDIGEQPESSLASLPAGRSSFKNPPAEQKPAPVTEAAGGGPVHVGEVVDTELSKAAAKSGMTPEQPAAVIQQKRDQVKGVAGSPAPEPVSGEARKRWPMSPKTDKVSTAGYWRNQILKLATVYTTEHGGTPESLVQRLEDGGSTSVVERLPGPEDGIQIEDVVNAYRGAKHTVEQNPGVWDDLA